MKKKITEVFGVAISPDGQTLVSGGQGKVVQIWDLQTGKLLRTLSGHLTAPLSAAGDERHLEIKYSLPPWVHPSISNLALRR